MNVPSAKNPDDQANFELAGLIHELKSPLAAIEGALEAIKVSPLKDLRLNGVYLTMIQKNVKRLNQSIKVLLDTINGLLKKGALNFKDTNLVRLCIEEAERNESTIQMRGLKLVIDIPTTPFIPIKGDPEKIRLVISNLLFNSIKFTEKGTIRLTVKRSGKKAIVSVEDTGCGIPKKGLPFVFDPFYQGVHGSSAGGTGIGLTMAKIWVRAHKGEIFASSKGVNQGARFWFTLPIK